MAMPKKLSGSRKIVALCDPALADFPAIKTKKLDNGQEVPDIGLVPYGATLDMAYLGELSKFAEPLTVFEVMPLQSRFMGWDRGESTDWRMVFQSHVIGIENFEADRELVWEKLQGFDYKTLTEESMEMILDVFIRDIANAIIQLAKFDGVTLPFSTLDISTGALRRCRAAKSLRIYPVFTAAAKTND